MSPAENKTKSKKATGIVNISNAEQFKSLTADARLEFEFAIHVLSVWVVAVIFMEYPLEKLFLCCTTPISPGGTTNRLNTSFPIDVSGSLWSTFGHHGPTSANPWMTRLKLWQRMSQVWIFCVTKLMFVGQKRCPLIKQKLLSTLLALFDKECFFLFLE